MQWALHCIRRSVGDLAMCVHVQAAAASANGAAAASANGAAGAKPPRTQPARRAVSRDADVGAGSLAHLAALTEPNAAVGIAVNQINAGRVDDALAILERVITGAGDAPNGPAHLARGTARAMQGQLEGMLPYLTLFKPKVVHQG